MEQPRWADGIHIVRLPNGNHLDVLLQQDPLNPASKDSVAVFFSGALPNRSGKPGPYFSGVRVAQALGIPLVAFSDPSLNFDGDTPLGWYAGSQDDHAQDSITHILKSATEKSGRDLLLVGGSGGGFASLYYSHRVGNQASAFVWNPQTSIIEYEIGAVKQYFNVAVPSNRFQYDSEAAKNLTIAKLAASGIETVLPRLDTKRVLYLQNATDWHVSKHLKPFLELNQYEHRGNGFYSNDLRHSVVISSFGAGHAVPPLEVIHSAIREMLSPARSTRAIYNGLIENNVLSHDFYQLPRDMRDEWDGLEMPFTINLRRNESQLSVEVDWKGSRPGVGGITVSFRVFGVKGQIQVVHRANSPYSLDIEAPRDAVRVEATFVDGFNNQLGTVSVPVSVETVLSSDNPNPLLIDHRPVSTSQPQETDSVGLLSPEKASTPETPLQIFVYGSCVSRDAFEEPDSPVLVDYRARSSLGSAFGSPTGLLEKISLDANPSAFQRRMVNTDLSKDLAPLIRDSTFDYLLVDFIDERLQLIRGENGYDTYSPELSRTGLEASSLVLVEPGSNEYMDAFRIGWRRLLEILPPEKILVNRVFWASLDEKGVELEGTPKILENNKLLQRLYDYVASFPGIRFIDYPEEMLRANPNHKWGVSPFHFSPALYRRTIEAMAAIHVKEARDSSQVEVSTTASPRRPTLGS